MYLPTFFKLYNEGFLYKLARYGSVVVPIGLWGKLFYKNQIYILFSEEFG